MINRERMHALKLLRWHQQGDEVATEKLLDYVATEFRWMIRQYHSSDPLLSFDDLQQAFLVGVWEALRVVKNGVGDPVYYLAYRGRLACKSLLLATARRRHGKDGDIAIHSFDAMPVRYEAEDRSAEYDPEAVVLIREERHEDHQRFLRIFARVNLRPRDWDVVDWFMDPTTHSDELGANKQLAQLLGVSEQRASVLKRRVVQQLRAADED